jgi:hypothetical protein
MEIQLPHFPWIKKFFIEQGTGEVLKRGEADLQVVPKGDFVTTYSPGNSFDIPF